MKILLQGVVGSKAYGLDTPDSDEDKLGIYQADNEHLVGLYPINETFVTTNPDSTHHEVGKFMRLALAANPTILELLWLDEYTVDSPAGCALREWRRGFLSNMVRRTYGGYALKQAQRLCKGGFESGLRQRTAKHGRHCYRLILQGTELLRTGEIRLRLTPDERREVFTAGEHAASSPTDYLEWVKERLTDFDSIDSVLPDSPRTGEANALLLHIREISETSCFSPVTRTGRHRRTVPQCSDSPNGHPVRNTDA